MFILALHTHTHTHQFNPKLYYSDTMHVYKLLGK